MVDYYEYLFEKNQLYLQNTQNIFKFNLEQIDLYSKENNTHKVVLSLKTTVTELMKMVENLNKENAKLKKLDRTNKVFRSLMFKYSDKLDLNKKQSEELKNKHSNQLNLLESENKNLVNSLREKEDLEKNLKLLQSYYEFEKSERMASNTGTSTSKEKDREQTNGTSILSNCDSPELTKSESQIYSNFNFPKIINSNKIILNDKFQNLKTLNEKLMKNIKKIEDNVLKFSFKKTLNSSNDLIDIVIKEFNNVNKIYRNFCYMDMLLSKAYDDFFYLYETSNSNLINSSSRTKTNLDEVIKKINKLYTNKLNKFTN